MKTRFSLDVDSGLFADRHGRTLGRITSVVIELAEGALDGLDSLRELEQQLHERSGGACERCGFDGDSLQIHHRTYERLGQEHIDDIELLCPWCHKAEHDRLAAAGTPLRRPNRSMGTRGSCSVLPSTTAIEKGRNPEKGRVVGEPKRPTASQLEREAIARIWDYWLEVSGKKQRLDSKRERIIRSALLTAKEMNDCSFEKAEWIVKRALLGLTLSPHHRGENEQRREYMEIRYALKGRGDESDDERIEKAVTWAAIYTPGRSALDPDRAQRLLEQIRYTLSLPHQPERDRAVEAFRRLRAAGFTVTRLSGPPWVRLTA